MKTVIIENMKKAMRMGFFHLLSANIFLQIAGFGMQIFLTRFLDPEDIGRIRILQSFIGIAVIVAGIGLNTAVLKFCSEDIADREKKKIFINAFKIGLYTSLSVTVLMFVLSFFNLYSEDMVINKNIKIYLFVIPFMVLNGLILAYLQAQKKVKEMSRVQILVKCINIVVVIGGVLLFQFKGYVWGMLLGVSLDVLAFLSFLKDEVKIYATVKVAKSYFNKLFKLGLYGFMTNALSQIIASTDVLLLNYLAHDAKQIGYYGTAQLVILGIRLVPTTLNQLVVPYISNNEKNITRVKEIYREYSRKTFLVMSCLTMLGLLAGPLGIKLVFGVKYTAAIPFFRVLLIGLFFWSLYAPKGIVLWGLGYVNYNFCSGLIVQVFNLAVNLILINRFGAMGAAYSTVLSYLLGMFVTGYFFNKAMKEKEAVVNC